VKKKRTISIKNPRLKKIRNNLRFALIEAVQNEKSKLYQRRFTSKSGGREQELNNLVQNSICKCRRCVATDKDMTYNPIDGAWYCVDCYYEMKQWTAKKKTGVSILFP